jgi:CO/xanthine dehydrogenase FAD-binding subunit
VIPAAFDYDVAESVEHAVGLLGGDTDAKALAGGHSLGSRVRRSSSTSAGSRISRM